MGDLRGTDLRALLTFIGEAEVAALSPLGALLPSLLDGLQRLVGCTIATANLYGTAVGYRAFATEGELAKAKNEEADLWLGLLPQHPLVSHWNRTGDRRPITMSDVITRRALHRLELYQYFCRPYDVEDCLSLRVSASGQFFDVSLTRAATTFRPRHRAVLDALRPYVALMLTRASLDKAAEDLRAALALTRRESDVVALAARGKSNAEIGAALFLAPGTVKKHLDRIYAKLGVSTRAQAVALAFRVANGGAKGRRILAGLLQTGDPAAAFGLTPRERDVVALVVQGKSNAEVGAALGLAAGTVKKHLDNVYEKLGVGSRTEAATRALSYGVTS